MWVFFVFRGEKGLLGGFVDLNSFMVSKAAVLLEASVESCAVCLCFDNFGETTSFATLGSVGWGYIVSIIRCGVIIALRIFLF